MTSKTNNYRVSTWLGSALFLATLLAIVGCSTPTVATPVPAALTSEPASVDPTLEAPTSVPTVAAPTTVPPTVTPLPIPTATTVPPTPAATATLTPTPTPTAVPTSPPPTATSTPEPTSTPIPTPVPTSTAIPTATVVVGTLPEGFVSAFIVSETLDLAPTPTATPFPTAVTPFQQPTATPAGTADLQPFFGEGAPVRVRNPNGGPFVEKSDLVVDFFVTNNGSTTVTGDYFIDIYVDDAMALRYSGINLEPSRYIFVEGATELLDRIHLDPGEHKIKMVIDPTNQISEISDGDNTYSANFTWSGPIIPTPLPTDRLPNLSLVGSPAGITVAPFLGASSSGGLSTNGETFITATVLNDSPITIAQEFNLIVLFDDVLAYNVNYTGLVGGSTIDLDWEGIAEAVRITPGEHTIKVIVDASGAIAESNESDNSIEITLVWGTGDPIAEPVPQGSSGAPIREVQVLPNLTGVILHGWDAAISASNLGDTLPSGTDGKIWAGSNTNISFTMRNSSRVNSATSGSFTTELYIDNRLIRTASLGSGNDAGSYWAENATIEAGTVEPGMHLVKMVIDSADDILEADESDNTVARWLEFLPGEPTTGSATAFVLSDEELTELLAPLTNPAFVDQVRATVGSGLDTPDWSNEILNAGKAGYYLLTGRDIDDERISMHMLPHDEFVAASFNACMTDYFLLSDPGYIATYESCTTFGGEIGFKFRLNGKIHVYVDLAENPILALGVYFHELGHALQDIENPALSESARTQNMRGLVEAEAQIFEAAALRTIGEYLGIDLLRFPDNGATRHQIQFLLDNNKTLTGSAEHVLGHTILWHEVLADTSGLNLDDELRANKRLSGASAKALFDYLVTINASDIDAWVAEIFSDTARADEFIAISLSRLENDLPTAVWGNPTLREPAFIVP